MDELQALVKRAGNRRRPRRDFIVDPGTGAGGWLDPSTDLDGLFGQVKKVGGTTVRLRVEPEWDLNRVDAAVAAARRHGLRVLMTPTGRTPQGAKWGKSAEGFPVASPAMARDFGAWVGQLGRRYRSVKRWSIYNEPDLMLEKGSFKTKGDAYRAIYREAQRQLAHAGHGPNQVLLGEVSPAAGARKFVRQLLKAGARLRAGGFAAHPYPLHHGPGGKTYLEGMTVADVRRKTKNGLTSGDMPALQRILAHAAKTGATVGKLPIFATEAGVYGSGPAAGHVAKALREFLEKVGVRSGAQYQIKDDAGFPTGLFDATGKPKPQLKGMPRTGKPPKKAERSGGAVHVRGYQRGPFQVGEYDRAPPGQGSASQTRSQGGTRRGRSRPRPA